MVLRLPTVLSQSISVILSMDWDVPMKIYESHCGQWGICLPMVLEEWDGVRAELGMNQLAI